MKSHRGVVETHKSKSSKHAVLLANVGQLLTLCSPSARSGPRRGPDLKKLDIVHDAAVLCVAGKIVSVGSAKDALSDPWIKKHRKRITEIDCCRKEIGRAHV